jgi:hypothetical protein
MSSVQKIEAAMSKLARAKFEKLPTPELEAWLLEAVDQPVTL